MQYQKELQIAKLSAKQAGNYLMTQFGKNTNKINYKKHQEIVTEADLAADKLIDSIITKNFPSHQILSEEIARKKIKNDSLWIVDPLDGTNNFAHHIPIFAVCIAFCFKETIKVGVVYLPYFKKMYWATENGGAFLNGKKINVSQNNNLKNSYIVQCHGNKEEEKKTDYSLLKSMLSKIKSTRRLGAAGFELTAVANGDIEGGYIVGTRPWDSSAGALIVREAGGTVTNFTGKPWQIFDKNIIFTNKAIHNKLLTIIKNHDHTN